MLKVYETGHGENQGTEIGSWIQDTPKKAAVEKGPKKELRHKSV